MPTAGLDWSGILSAHLDGYRGERLKVEEFWNAVILQNREKLPSFFTDDAVIRWHCTNEQFSVLEYVRVNCDYPGKWKGEIERIEKSRRDNNSCRSCCFC